MKIIILSNKQSIIRWFVSLYGSQINSQALPRLATGVGGLEWNDVMPLIEERLGDLEIPIYVYTEFHVGMQAKEP